MSLFLDPWIGGDFANQKQKLLLIGESHYDTYGNFSKNFTIEIIDEIVKHDAPYKFFVNTGNLFYDDHKKIWNEVAFSNIYQRAFTSGSAQPTQQDKATAWPNFLTLLNTVRPDKVIVLSKRLWGLIPTDEATFVNSIQTERQHSNIWRYSYDETSCLAVGICHSSWMFGNKGTVEQWGALVNKFLQYQPD